MYNGSANGSELMYKHQGLCIYLYQVLNHLREESKVN